MAPRGSLWEPSRVSFGGPPGLEIVFCIWPSGGSFCDPSGPVLGRPRPARLWPALLGYEPTEEYILNTYGDGWKKKEVTNIPPAGNGAPVLPNTFSEVSGLTLKRAGIREDQQSLVDAAEFLATKYQELYGNRIEQLLTYMEETGDIETFRKKLTELMQEVPPEETVETIQKATLFGRLMGLFRGQREA